VVGFLAADFFCYFFFYSDESFKVSWLHRYKYAKNKMYRCARSQGHRRAGMVNRPGSRPVLSGSEHTEVFIKRHFITAISRFIFSLHCIIKCELFAFLWKSLGSAQSQNFIWRMGKGFIHVLQNPVAISEHVIDIVVPSISGWSRNQKTGSCPDFAADLLCKHRKIFYCSCCEFPSTLSFPS